MLRVSTSSEALLVLPIQFIGQLLRHNQMGLLFQKYGNMECCLCGVKDNLTREHKIKASELRREFGQHKMFIQSDDGSDENARQAQGPKSQEFYFGSPMCANCNGSLTQAPDREFEHFHKFTKALFTQGKDPMVVFELEQYAVNTQRYLNVFRYFAKLLCCHMADVSAPRRQVMTKLARGVTQVNSIWLSVDIDPRFKTKSAITDAMFAAHGGLAVSGDKRTGDVNGFHSTLTIGAIRYVFFSRLNTIETWAIKLAHPEFYKWCRERIKIAQKQPMPHKIQVLLGFISDDG